MPIFSLPEISAVAHQRFSTPAVTLGKDPFMPLGNLRNAEGLSLRDVAASHGSNPEQAMRRFSRTLSSESQEQIVQALALPEARSLDPRMRDFLGAVIGRPPEVSSFEQGSLHTLAPQTPGAQTRQAVTTLRSLVQNGQLKAYYDAAIGLPSAYSQEEALAVFRALPELPANARAQDFVTAGYWDSVPKGLEALASTPRFIKGRQVIVETQVDNRAIIQGVRNPNFMGYLQEGPRGRTYRAELAGEDGNHFLVKVDGRTEPLSVPKADIFGLNASHSFEGTRLTPGVSWGKKSWDYSSPFLKAKIAELAIELKPLVENMDFEAALRGNGWRSVIPGLGSGAARLREAQTKAVEKVFRAVDMLYPKPEAYRVPGRDSGNDAGRLAVRGIGMCHQQAGVTASLLAPFREALGVDVQMISGADFSTNLGGTNARNPLGNGSSHGWLHVVFRPSMGLSVLDRTWNQVNLSADQAYSVAGRRYPMELVPGLTQTPPSAADLTLNGLSLGAHQREEGVEGQVGREQHIGNTQVYQ